jgi:hypothetical protein
MVRSSDSVVISNGPDFAMRLGADELSHTFSFVVNRSGLGKASLVPSGVSSDRSLAAAVEGLKQKIAPYGWTANTEIQWSRGLSFSGIFSVEACNVVIGYRFHEKLNANQRVRLADNIEKSFLVL